MVVTPQGQSMGGLVTTINSMARMTEQEAAGVKSRKIHLVRVRAGDTPASLAKQMAYSDHQLERFLVLNGLKNGESLTPGTTVKLVVL
jgi:predicted Zn-dependent protease